MVVGALRQGLPALGPELRDTFALSVGEVGIVFGVLAAGMTLGLIPFGALADRMGERPVLAAGLLALLALAGHFVAIMASQRVRS